MVWWRYSGNGELGLLLMASLKAVHGEGDGVGAMVWVVAAELVDGSGG